MRKEFNKYDVERSGILDSFEIKKYIKNEFGVIVSDAIIRKMIHEKTMGEELSHLTFKQFNGFRKLLETNK